MLFIWRVTDLPARIQCTRKRRAASCTVSHPIQRDSNAVPVGPICSNEPKSAKQDRRTLWVKPVGEACENCRLSIPCPASEYGDDVAKCLVMGKGWIKAQQMLEKPVMRNKAIRKPRFWIFSKSCCSSCFLLLVNGSGLGLCLKFAFRPALNRCCPYSLQIETYFLMVHPKGEVLAVVKKKKILNHCLRAPCIKHNPSDTVGITEP